MKQPTSKIKTMIAERLDLSIRNHVSLRHWDGISSHLGIEVYLDHQLSTMVFELEKHLYGIPRPRIKIHKKWPVDWWQAFRLRWLPTWWLKWYPVKYEHLDIDKAVFYGICPHLSSDRKEVHLAFLAQSIQEKTDEH